MITISQTLIKAFKNPVLCPRKINDVFILKKADIKTESMTKGDVFESLSFNKKDVEIPTLKNGQMSVDYQRILQQADVFRNQFSNDHEIKIIDRKKRITSQWSNDILLSGEIDIQGEILDLSIGPKPIYALMDIKLTKNLNSQFGAFSWAIPMAMDHTQVFMYTHLWKQNFGPELPFYYLVFDYKPVAEYKIIRKTVSDVERQQFQESIARTVEKVNYYNDNGWDEKPSYEECKNCPLKEDCKSYLKAKPVEVI